MKLHGGIGSNWISSRSSSSELGAVQMLCLSTPVLCHDGLGVFQSGGEGSMHLKLIVTFFGCSERGDTVVPLTRNPLSSLKY